MKDIMIDCETLSTRHDAMIVQVGLIVFDPDGKGWEREGRWAIEIENSSGHIDPGTVRWWMRQADEARKAVFDPPHSVSLYEILCVIADNVDRIREEYGTVRLWSRGDMDRQWLESAFRRSGRNELPWRYYEWRDQREFCRPWTHLVMEKEPVGVPHDALSDCMTQVWWVQQVRKITAPMGAGL